MSEYLNKKAVLEWLKKQQKKQEENRDRLEIDHQYWEYHEGASDYLSLAVEEFESGAFDADESEGTWKATAEVLGRENAQLDSEIQRLQAELCELEQEAEQREKLVECLRFYERMARGREANDGGRRARTLLAEIGVTVMQHEPR